MFPTWVHMFPAWVHVFPTCKHKFLTWEHNFHLVGKSFLKAAHGIWPTAFGTFSAFCLEVSQKIPIFAGRYLKTNAYGGNRI